MSSIGLTVFRGSPGRAYPFHACHLNANLKNVGAIYALKKRTRRNGGKDTHNIIYIGQTSKLEETITEYKKGLWLEQPQVNCVCVHLEKDEEQRKKKIIDMSQHYNPKMKTENPDHRPSAN